MLFGGLEHAVRGISAGDVEPKEWEVGFTLAIFSPERFVDELGWADEGPVELAALDNGFHCGGVFDDAGTEEAAEEVRGWEQGVFEEEGGGDDYATPAS